LDRTAKVWDAQTGQQLGPSFRHEAALSQARFNADGQVLLTLGQDGSLHFWEIGSGQAKIEPLQHQISGFDLAANGRVLVTVSTNLVCRWNVGPWPPGPRRVSPQSAGTPTQFSPDGQLRIDHPAQDCVQVVWAKTGQPLSEPLCHGAQVTAALFSGDGERLLTASEDTTARVWDSRTGLPTSEPFKHSRPVKSAAFGAQRHQITVVLNDNTTWLWEVPMASARVPGWLAELAEAVAGQRLSENGISQPVGLAQLLALTRKLAGVSASDGYVAWEQRLLAERAQLMPWEPKPQFTP
jgi:WD40 repeat protein